MKSEQIDYGSGAQKLRLQLQRAKKANAQGYRALKMQLVEKVSKKTKALPDLKSGINELQDIESN